MGLNIMYLKNPGNKKEFILHIFLISLIIFVIFFSGINSVIAEQREFEVKRYEENITVPTNSFRSIDINYHEGKELEVIYELKVNNNLPVDVWFVNDDNFLLLSASAQFLFYIDGSGTQVTNVKRIVSLDEYDDYKLVITNYYANRSVEIDIEYELRIYPESSWLDNISLIIIISLSIIVIILVIFLVLFSKRIQKLEEHRIRKEIKGRSKKKRSKGTIISKDNKNRKQEIESEPFGFCGYCGKQVDTPYCRSCGKNVQSK